MQNLSAQEKRYEKIRMVLNNLKEIAAIGIPIIVEGQKDIDALLKMGIVGDIITAKGYGKSLIDVIFEIENTNKEEIILLLDFDRRGHEWTSRLTKYLESIHKKPNLVFWKELKALIGRNVNEIEGIYSYMKKVTSKSRKNVSISDDGKN